MPSQGDIALVPVPFTDLSSVRRRPVIVLSNNSYNVSTSDMVVVAMTSNPAPTPFSFMISNADLISGKLNHPGKVRVDKIYALSQNTAVKIFGKVADSVLDHIRQRLIELCKS